MNIAIVGSRGINDYELVKRIFNKYYGESDVSLIVSGGAKGVDTMAEKLADELKINKLIFHPDWDKHGKAAGFIRNKNIVENADEVLAFWDGLSKGTKYTIGLANDAKKKVIVVEVLK